MSPPKHDIWREILQTRRQAQELSERWEALGCQIYHQGRVIGSFKNAKHSTLVARCHNTWLLVTNTLIAANRRLRDRDELQKVQRKEK